MFRIPKFWITLIIFFRLFFGHAKFFSFWCIAKASDAAALRQSLSNMNLVCFDYHEKHWTKWTLNNLISEVHDP